MAAPQCKQYLVSEILFFKSYRAHRPFPWPGLRDHKCSTILGECIMHSANFWYAQRCLDYLKNSTFLADLDHIVSCFDKITKLRFQNSGEPHYVKFGGARDNDPSCNIRFGQLKLLGSDVATFFEASLECIVKAVLDQCKVAHKPICVRRPFPPSSYPFLELAF